MANLCRIDPGAARASDRRRQDAGQRRRRRARVLRGSRERVARQQHDAADGVVVYAGDGIKGYGNLVLLRHGGGFVTAYAHIDRILVKANDAVQRGQVIAKSGRAGTTPLLHFEIRKGSAAVDPKRYLPPPG